MNLLEKFPQYADRAFAGWLGKNVGGTLGEVFEGESGILYLDYYEPVPQTVRPNDDLDIQLIWLEMLNKRGIYLTPSDFQYYFLNFNKYHISEYFMGQRNLEAGVRPPLSGLHNNWFIHGMGSTIRSEIWAMICPGQPDLAAAYAYMDGSVDHALQGLWGEIFMAAIESMAFTESDPQRLIHQALQYIPQECEVSQAVRFVCDEYKKQTNLIMLRHKLAAQFSHPTDFTYVPVNIAFIVMGLLWGADFGDAICKAVNCGFDTDCTGASLGALLGLMHGQSFIEPKWLNPIGTSICTGWGVPKDFPTPKDIDDLTRQVSLFASQIIENEELVRRHLSRWTNLEFLAAPASASMALPPSTRVILLDNDQLHVEADYLDHAAIGYRKPKRLELFVTHRLSETASLQLELSGPQDWSLKCNQESLENLAPNQTAVCSLLAEVNEQAELCPANNVHLRLSAGGRELAEASLVLEGMTQWLTTEPLSDAKLIEQIEAVGDLPAENHGLHWVQLATDDLSPLLPAQPGQVVFARVHYLAEAPRRIRLVANNTGPISVYFNATQVIDKTWISQGLLPSCHLQKSGDVRTVCDNGYADLTLAEGLNTFLVKLTATAAPQDIVFHLMGVKPDAPEKLVHDSFKLLDAVSNVRTIMTAASLR